MKKQRRKLLSVERRDIWDNPRDYCQLGYLSTDKLKHMLKHKSKKDRRLKGEIWDILRWRKHVIG